MHISARITRPVNALAILLLPLCVSKAHADIPAPGNSTVEPYIVASWTTNPAPTGFPACGAPRPGFDVVVRDIIGNPVNGATVILDFSATGLALYATQNPGATINCAARTISKLSDAFGHAGFVARFGRFDNGSAVEVSADGVILVAPIPARSPDLDGDGAVALADLGMFARRYSSGIYFPEIDYDGCPNQSLADFAFFAQEYLVSTMSAPAPICP